MPVNAFFSELLINYQSHETHYKSSILDQYQAQIRQGNAYLRQIPFSDLKAYETIFSKLPEQIHLQLANSSTVRYAQLFDMPQQAEVFSNRGTSGIDGSTATAVGAALINQNPSLLVTGDLSFFYDINGLWNDHIPSNFRVILINNQGGGIFRILPGVEGQSKIRYLF